MINNEQERTEKVLLCARYMNFASYQEDFTRVVILLNVYDSSIGSRVYWLDKEGKENYHNDVIEKRYIDPIAYTYSGEIQKFDEVNGQPWTHVQFSLLPSGKLTTDFAMIPVGDNFPGLHMSGVSELQENELDKHYIPLNHWKECVEKYKGTYDKNLREETYQIDMTERPEYEDTDYTVIYENIAKLMFNIEQPNTKTMYFYGQIFDDKAHGEFAWHDINDNFQTFYQNNLEEPLDIFDKIIHEIQTLRKMTLFEKEQWTHIRVTLTTEGKFDLYFAYIPQENSWNNLYLNAVSALSLDEALQHGISEEHWKHCVAKFGD